MHYQKMNLQLEIRIALSQDLPQIVTLLADDPLGLSHESTDQGTLPQTYHEAFRASIEDPHNDVVVAAMADAIASAPWP